MIDYSRYGLQISGDCLGEDGMKRIMHYVFTKQFFNLYQVKHALLGDADCKYGVISTLQVIPVKEETYNPNLLSRWNRQMSTKGGTLKRAPNLTKSDLTCFNNLLSEFLKQTIISYYDIPSDTGLVALRKDGTLTALEHIPENTIITYITTTASPSFNPKLNILSSPSLFRKNCSILWLWSNV